MLFCADDGSNEGREKGSDEINKDNGEEGKFLFFIPKVIL